MHATIMKNPNGRCYKRLNRCIACRKRYVVNPGDYHSKIYCKECYKKYIENGKKESEEEAK